LPTTRAMPRRRQAQHAHLPNRPNITRRKFRPAIRRDMTSTNTTITQQASAAIIVGD
jgi:hypothetical protein